jgi:hypothetical protein
LENRLFNSLTYFSKRIKLIWQTFPNFYAYTTESENPDEFNLKEKYENIDQKFRKNFGGSVRFDACNDGGQRGDLYGHQH